MQWNTAYLSAIFAVFWHNTDDLFVRASLDVLVGETTIGRTDDQDVTISDPSVSGSHAVIDVLELPGGSGKRLTLKVGKSLQVIMWRTRGRRQVWQNRPSSNTLISSRDTSARVAPMYTYCYAGAGCAHVLRDGYGGAFLSRIIWKCEIKN